MSRRLNVPVPDADALERLAGAKGPLGSTGRRSAFRLLRETYFDTPDGTLRDQRVTLCLRVEAGGGRTLVYAAVQAENLQGIVDEEVVEVPVSGSGLYATLAGASEVATRIKALVDPMSLRPQVALDVDREARELRTRWLRGPVRTVTFDQIVAHTGEASRAFQEISVVEPASEAGGLEALADRIRSAYGLPNVGVGIYERVWLALVAPQLAARVDAPAEVLMSAVLLRDGEVALVDGEGGLCFPTTRGSGEDLAREYVADLLGSPDPPELELVGFAPSGRGGSDLEMWLAEAPTTVGAPAGLTWIPFAELLERAGAPRLRDPRLVAALLLLARSDVGTRLLGARSRRGSVPRELPLATRDPSEPPGEDEEDLIDMELSILDFNLRVLELAEDEAMPLLERFRFLSIVASNLDEYFVVRVGRLKVEGSSPDHDHAGSRGAGRLFDLVQIRVRALVARAHACLTGGLLPSLAELGIRLRAWTELAPDERRGLTTAFEREIFPLLTPLSLSVSPGRSFPRLVGLGLSLAAVLHKEGEPDPRFGCVQVPDGLARFWPVPGSQDLVPIEEIIVANAAALFPGAEVRMAHVFRVTRIGDVEIDEDNTGSLIQAVADEVEARPYKPVVRVEVQRAMPREVQAYLLRELRAERGTDTFGLGRADVYEVDGLVDLAALGQIASLGDASDRFPPFEARKPLEEEPSLWDVLGRTDVLVYHPYDDFDATVGRFLRDAAADPDVAAIKLTLYRTGRDSPVMEALLGALESGKDVSIFVELKARFDEESNIEWTRKLHDAGAHVVTGLRGFKTHAKTALVVRKEAGGPKRYVHVGTGNYNASTARFYTDFGLMSSDADLGADLNDFFNELTGSAGPPQKAYRRLLVAPVSLADEIIRMIDRERSHARAGRPARIQAKLNGLADAAVVKRLYEASCDGVQIDLVVRSICTLRPGVPGLSETIRVRSVLGRFLEHSRIYYFENGGQSEYYIGSADWRARNLRRRVEVAAPVDDASARATLREVLDAELEDPRAWVLRPDGVFERLRGEGPTSQERWMERAARDREPAA